MNTVQGTAGSPGRFQPPDPLTTRALLLRSFGLWIGARLIYMLVAAYAMMPVGIVPAVVPLFAAAVGGLAIIDLRAMRDDIFLANLGVGARHVFAFACGVALTCEAVVAVLFLALRA